MNKKILIILANGEPFYWGGIQDRLEFEGFDNITLTPSIEEALQTIPENTPCIMVSEIALLHSLESTRFSAAACHLGAEVRKRFPLCKTILYPVVKDEEAPKHFDFFIHALEEDSMKQLVKKIQELSSQPAA